MNESERWVPLAWSILSFNSLTPITIYIYILKSAESCSSKVPQYTVQPSSCNDDDINIYVKRQ